MSRKKISLFTPIQQTASLANANLPIWHLFQNAASVY